MIDSVEKQARRALRRMVFYRLCGELFTLPQYICRAIASVLQVTAQWFRNLEMAVFYLELDAARRYKLLTQLDMGTAAGDPGRYGMLDPHRAETFQDGYMGRVVSDEDE